MSLARRLLGSIAVCALLAVFASACSSTVSLEPAEDANNPECARVIAQLKLQPNVAGESRRWTDAQATGAWGSPVSIILRCGVPVPGPSELPCFYLGGTDWLAFPEEDGLQRVVTFGRDPAFEVAIARTGALDFATVLEELGQLIDTHQNPAVAACSERTSIRG
ncbi:DUF3515 family protein [Microbacterium lushaniae]